MHIPTDLLIRILREPARRRLEWNAHHSKIFDTTAAQKDLGFQYRIRWREGVKRIVAWLDEPGGIEPGDAHPGCGCEAAGLHSRIEAWN